MAATVSPVFFPTAAAFRRWLEEHHDSARELWVGLYKKHSAKTGIKYAEAVDQALCFGWIDGIAKRVDDDGYMQRFTPRTPKSNWSNANIKRVGQLRRLGLMHEHGLETFRRRDPARCGVYSFENRPKRLAPALEQRLKANGKAWMFFRAQPPGYRRLMVFFVMSAKLAPTRERRLARLIDASEQRERLI